MRREEGERRGRNDIRRLGTTWNRETEVEDAGDGAWTHSLITAT